LRLIKLLEMRNIDPATVCHEAGVSIEEVTTKTARVPYSVNDALVEACAARIAPQDLSIVLAGVRDLDTYDAAGLVLLTSPTLREGLARAFGYQRLWGDGQRFTLVDPLDDGGGGLAVRFRHPGKSPLARASLAELAVLEVMSAAQGLVDSNARARSVSFVHRASDFSADDAHLVRSLTAIFGVEPTFGSTQNQIVFDETVANGALQVPAVVLREVLEKIAQRTLAALPKTVSLAVRVRAICKEDPSSFNASIGEIAKRMHMSSRTLQRQLQDEGTSWGDLVDQMRHDLAIDLKKKGASEKEITFLLGFSDPSSLTRARARWRR